LSSSTGLPDTQEPDPIELLLGEFIEFSIRDIVKCGSFAKLSGKLSEPDTCIDLVQAGILGSGIHSIILSSSGVICQGLV
jgi:hypothetical protein